jgi:hypothetical protein
MQILNTPKLKFNWLRLLPYITVGSLIFYFNSQLELNYLIKGYLTLMECQLCILFTYLINKRA